MNEADRIRPEAFRHLKKEIGRSENHLIVEISNIFLIAPIQIKFLRKWALTWRLGGIGFAINQEPHPRKTYEQVL